MGTRKGEGAGIGLKRKSQKMKARLENEGFFKTLPKQSGYSGLESNELLVTAFL